ncbi:MAG TPA: hypothetical protein VG734_03535 [Lacunisphaera sp.]|nr:hypothetical protein [Lacunisphaera sp.]
MIESPPSNGSPDRANRTPVGNEALRLGLVLVMVAVGAYYGALHWAVLRIPHPITQDEPGFIEITAAPNAYAADNWRTCGNVYGPGYAAFARPFTAVIANPYSAHRWANTVALAFTLGLLAWQLRRKMVGRLETAAAVVIVYALNVSSHSLAASSDLLASGLCFAALVVGSRGTWPALAGCLLLSVLGGLTKLYAVFGWVAVATYLVLFAPRARALAFLGLSAVVSLLCAALQPLVAPGYYLSTFVVHWAATTPSLTTWRNQAAEFGLLACGLLILALGARPQRPTIAVAAGRPLVSPAPDFWAWAAAVAAIVLLGKLGWHAGNYLVYYYHLLLLPLAVIATRRIACWPRAGRALLLVNLLVLGWQIPPWPGNSHWSALEGNVAQVNGRVLAEPLLQPLTTAHPNVELFEHGQTASILQALDWLGPATPPAFQGARDALRHDAEILRQRIRAREFAAIYLSYQDLRGQSVWSYDRERFAEVVATHYRPVGEILFKPYGAPFWDRKQHGQYLYHLMQWVPREPAPAVGNVAPPR